MTGAGAAIGADIGADTAVPPHELHPLGAEPPHELHPEGAHESQLDAESHLLLHLKILASKPRLPIFRPHPLSQDGAPQGSHAAISAPQLGPQLGAAPQPEPHEAISAPQLGPAPQAGAPQASAQPE